MTKKGIITDDHSGLLVYIDSIVENKRKAGRTGTASIYQAVRNNFALFCQFEARSVCSLNSSIIESFRDYLQSKGLRVNTISNYLSVMRAIYNKGLAEHRIKSDGNSFKKLKLHPVSTHKRAISMDVIMEVTRLDLKAERLIFARDLFVFSFMACGISFVDLSHLTHKNIVDNTLVYRRTKTKTEICVPITPGMRCLIDHYSDKRSAYLFPILKGGESYEQYKVALRTYNRRLNEIGKLLPFPIKLTSYVARHSWAMQAKENNVSIAIIGEALGHTSEKTTHFYLSNLDQSILNKANQKITVHLDEWVMNANLKIDPYL